MSKRTSLAWAGAALLCAASCSQPKSLPAPPDDSAAQKSMWQLAPTDAVGGVVLADPARLLERLRALKALLDSGPETRVLVQKGMEQAILHLGFDPLDADAWKKAGIDPAGPIGLFFKDGPGELVFRATDPGKAHDTIFRALAPSDQQNFDCGAAGGMQRCGTPGWALATDATHSLWPRLEADVGANVRSMGLVAYAPLDVGPIKTSLDKDSDYKAAGMRAGYFGLQLAPERMVLRGGLRADSMKTWGKFTLPRSTGTLLGLGDGAVSAMHFTFSPTALWSFARGKDPKTFDQGLALALGTTGLDLDKDVASNLTGEMFWFTYRGDKRGPDGKEHTLVERAGGAFVLGTLDDQKSRRVVDRLSEMAGGAIGMFAETAKTSGYTPSYAKEGDVHWFTVDIAPAQAKELGMTKLELFVTTIPGALVIGEGRSGFAEMKKRLGHKPNAFLDKLPLPGERELFERAPFAVWSRAGDGFAQKMEMSQAMPMAALLGAGTSKLFGELMQLGQLLFDSTLAVEVTDDRAELSYQVTYL